jgi:hypothetical protein
LAISLEPRRRSRPLRLDWWALCWYMNIHDKKCISTW